MRSACAPATVGSMDIETLVDRHLATWSEDDPGTRRRSYAELYADDVRLVEPGTDGRGHDAVDEAITGLRSQLPGHVFARDGAVSHHHEAATYRWTLGPQGGAPAATGSDVLLISDDRIGTAFVFIDAPG